MSRLERLASLFRRSPGLWFDGRELATVGGAYAWRTRVSELRRGPFFMHIENRQRTITRTDGTAFTVSEYRLLLPTSTRKAATSEFVF
jgi:hypothetical protein